MMQLRAELMSEDRPYDRWPKPPQRPDDVCPDCCRGIQAERITDSKGRILAWAGKRCQTCNGTGRKHRRGYA